MRHRTPIALVTVLALVAACGAAADDGAADGEATPRQSEEILRHIDRPDPGKGWLALHLNHVAVHKKAGLAYTRELDIGERGMTFSLRGPALGRKKRLGISVEIRF